jgi:hypothetical protein
MEMNQLTTLMITKRCSGHCYTEPFNVHNKYTNQFSDHSYTRGNPKEPRVVSLPPNSEEWKKDISTCSLDPQLSVVRRMSSCNNEIGRTVCFREGRFCDPVKIVLCDFKEQKTCLKFCFLSL